MIIAVRRPDLVRKLVIIGTAVNIHGGTPIAQAMTSQLTADHLPPALIEAYGASRRTAPIWLTSQLQPWLWPQTMTS